MSDQIILNADVRERTGSNKARVIRKIDGMVPAIVYGDEKETINIKLKLNELTKASENELFYTQVLLIKTGDNEEKVVLKGLQKDPAKGKFLHADFQRVSSKTKLKVVIPVNFVNEEDCVGVKVDGGVVAKTIREIERSFGKTFSEDIQNLTIKEWSGPLISEYGSHLVFINSVAESFTPNLEEIKNIVQVETKSFTLS